MKNADRALPSPLAKMTYGYGYESQILPNNVYVTTHETLKSARVIVEGRVADDIDDVYVGMKRLTGK